MILNQGRGVNKGGKSRECQWLFKGNIGHQMGVCSYQMLILWCDGHARDFVSGNWGSDYGVCILFIWQSWKINPDVVAVG